MNIDFARDLDVLLEFCITIVQVFYIYDTEH